MMTVRYAVYYSPARDSAFWHAGAAWLDRPELAPVTVSARRYGFHATLRAPMRLNGEFSTLQALAEEFAERHRPIQLAGLAPRLIDGFVALTTEPQPAALTNMAAELVEAFEVVREPLSTGERQRRLAAPLTPRQVELLDTFGYPYVLEQFQFHMTLTDRLPAERQTDLLNEAGRWFSPVLATPPLLDRLVIFTEPEPGAPFRRLDPDFVLAGA